MGRPVRHFHPDGYYFVTARCFQARLLLVPSDETNALVGGTLARAVALHAIELFGYVVASNHLHLLLRAPRGNLPSFMQYLLSNTAKKVGRLVSWRGGLWERRYSAEPVLDDDAMVGRLRYILSHGVKEGLVPRCSQWPGLSCLLQLVSMRVRRFQWFDWTRRWKCTPNELKGRALLDERWAREVELELKPLPCWANLPETVRRQRVSELVASIERDGRVSGTGVLGRKRVLSQRPHRRPANIKRSARPLCHASTQEGRNGYRELYASFVATFREASKRWRAGQLGAFFPRFSVRPFLWPQAFSAGPA
jgi:REP element-mobilizing transposase RayT